MVTTESLVLFEAGRIINEHQDIIQRELDKATDVGDAQLLQGLLDSIPRAMLLIGWIAGDANKRARMAQEQAT
jgi:hypothetical protein